MEHREWKETPTCIECGEDIYHDSDYVPTQGWSCYNPGCVLHGIGVECDVAYRVSQEWINANPVNLVTIFVVVENKLGKLELCKREANKSWETYRIKGQVLPDAQGTYSVSEKRVGFTPEEAIDRYIDTTNREISEKQGDLSRLTRQIEEAGRLK